MVTIGHRFIIIMKFKLAIGILKNKSKISFILNLNLTFEIQKLNRHLQFLKD